MQLLSKITMKMCGLTIAAIKKAVTVKKNTAPVGEPEKIEDVFEGKAPLLRIAGIVNRTEAGQTTTGDFLRLIGEFTAINLLTGEVFQSPQCILPGFVGALLAPAVREANGNNVQFAFEVGAKGEPTAVLNYAFTFTSLIEPKPTNAMAALLASVGMDKPAALAAPAPSAADPAPAPAADLAPVADKPAAKTVKK